MFGTFNYQLNNIMVLKGLEYGYITCKYMYVLK